MLRLARAALQRLLPTCRQHLPTGCRNHLDRVTPQAPKCRARYIGVRIADRAPGFCVPRRGKGLPPLAPHPHPRVWPPASASLRMVRLDEVEQFAENQTASVASLRWCSPSARNGVRLPSGMLFSLAGIPIVHTKPFGNTKTAFDATVPPMAFDGQAVSRKSGDAQSLELRVQHTFRPVLYYAIVYTGYAIWRLRKSAYASSVRI